MTSKLTLSIDKNTIEKAKAVSRRKGKSLSKLVEEYLNSLSMKTTEDENPIASIRKIMKGKIINQDIDWKKEKADRLKRKYDL